MPFGIGFIFLLMLVGGVAAYWGDRVGMVVGRRRLSFLGLRPKYTSRVIAVGTGILIVLFTLTTLLILSNSVRRALFGMDELQGQIVQLSTEVSTYQLLRDELEASNEALQAHNRELQTRADELLQLSEELELETRQLERDKLELQTEIATVEAELEEARLQLEDLQRDVELFRTVGFEVFNVAQTLYGANFLVRAGEPLGTLLIDVTGDEEDVLQELNRSLAEVEASLLARGIGDVETGEALRLDRIYEIEGQLIGFSEDEVLQQALVPLIQAAEQGYKGVIVQLIAVTNAMDDGVPVFADFHPSFVPNEIVFPAGSVIAEREFDPLLPRPQIFEEFITFVQGEIRQIARAHLYPPDGDYGAVSFAEAYSVVDQISRHNRPVRVRAVASRDIMAYDSLEVRFQYQILSDSNATGL